ncbi:MAG: hypothetical protein E7648_02045 [Ruminococcaceae bacterium]|nr:hypothetical protein [Oscillospiraceae bacterium]
MGLKHFLNFILDRGRKGGNMKKLSAIIAIVAFTMLNLTGCSSVGGKNASFSVVYGACALLSLLLLIGSIFAVRKKRFWVIMLFSSVLVVNIGYTFLSLSRSLDAALWANRISYLGSVFLPLSMLMIILDVTNTKYRKLLPRILISISVIIFLIAASPGILPIYYKEVSFETVDGASRLVKVYGVLHPLYLIYLISYFIATVTVIIRASVKKTVESIVHSVILGCAVFVNIGVWFIEQISDMDFEMLSVSYIISELFLLGIRLVINENQRLREIVKRVEGARDYSESDRSAEKMLEKPVRDFQIAPERVETFIMGLKSLTLTEKAICDAHIARVTTKEIMANMNIKESTLKYHNRNIYGKLGVTTRKELLELHKYIKSVQSNLDG